MSTPKDSETATAPPVRSTDGLEAVPCDCANWARSVDLKYLTNHHSRCTRYNDSLIDVWKVTDRSSRCYFDDEAEAMLVATLEAHDSEGPPITVTKEKMHREVFDNLPEFEGF